MICHARITLFHFSGYFESIITFCNGTQQITPDLELGGHKQKLLEDTM